MAVTKNEPDQATPMRMRKKICEKLHPRADEKSKPGQTAAMRTRNETYEKLYLRPDEENGSWFGEDLGGEVRVVPVGHEVEERFRQLLRIANGETNTAAR